MELDQRVKVIEYELKILKNEIHRMLKEVEEHVLVDYKTDASAAQAKPGAGESVIKKVSLDEIRKTQAELVGEAEVEHAKKFAAWATGNVERLGTRRMNRLIDLCADKDILTPALRATLTQIVAQTNENGPLKAPLTQALDAILKLDQLVGRPADGEEALALIEEANLG